MFDKPFWCQKNHCWIRFKSTKEGLIIVEVASCRQDYPTLAEDWHALKVTKGIWTVYYEEEPEALPIFYCLKDNVLYRTNGQKNTLTNFLNINKISPNGWGPHNSQQLNPFSDYELIADAQVTTYSALPLIQETQQAKWQKFPKENIRDMLLDFEENSFFSGQQRKLLLRTLEAELSGFLPQTFLTAVTYLEALKSIITNKNNPWHRQLIVLASRTDFDQEAGFKGIGADSELHQCLFIKKRDFFFNLLRAEAQYVSDCFGLELIIPVSPSISKIANVHLNFNEEYLNREDNNPEGEALGEELGLYTDALAIKFAVVEAQQNYQNWYEKLQTNLRGANGFFTWFRHGRYGQQRAANLNKRILEAKTNDEAIQMINDFLLQKETRYHRHSFASFLLDELTKLPNSPWDHLYPDEKSRCYGKNEIINHLSYN